MRGTYNIKYYTMPQVVVKNKYALRSQSIKY
jgi:hypothetical protein